MSRNKPHDSLTQVLVGSGASTVKWQDSSGVGSPYYVEQPEPAQVVIQALNAVLPFVVYEMPESKLEWTKEGSYQEIYEPTVRVYGRQEDVDPVLNPYVSTSVLHFLDGLAMNASLLSGDTFAVTGFERQGWTLRKEETRDIGGGRVWVAEARFWMLVVFKRS